MRIVYFCLLCTIALFTSCNKDDVSGYNNDASLSTVAVFNAVVSTDNVNLSLGNNHFNTAAEKVPMGAMLEHQLVIPGNHQLEAVFHISRSSFGLSAENVLIESGKAYSLFLFGRGEGNVKWKTVEDDLIVPSNGRIKVRFANMRVDNTSVRFSLGVGGNSRSETVASGEVTGFIELDRNVLPLVMTGMGGVFSELSVEFSPENRGVYTVWVWGSPRRENAPAGTPYATPFTVTKH